MSRIHPNRSDAHPPPQTGILALALLAPVPLLLLPLLGAGSGSEGAAPGVARLPFLACALLAGGAWAVALRHVGGRARASRDQVVALVLGAGLLRLLAFAGDPGLSDDRHRYVFEGALVLEGESPWAAPPAAAEREAHRARWPATAARVNHPEVAAAYPPAMQATCAVGVAIGGLVDGVRGDDPAAEAIARRERVADGAVRALHALADFAVLLPLGLLLAARGLSLGWLLAWGGCPLVLLAFPASGHFDSVGILAAISALALWDRGVERLGRLALGLGVLVKFLPALALVGGLGSGRGRRRAAGVGLVVVVGIGLAALLEGGFALGGLGDYGLRWRSTPGLFRFVEPLFEWTGARDGGWTDPRRVARGAIGLLFLIMCGRCFALHLGPVRSMGLLLFGFVVLSPTLHPWYVTWLVPFLPLVANPGALYLAATAPLLYWPVWSFREHGMWEDPAGLFWIVVAPALVLAALPLARAYAQRRNP